MATTFYYSHTLETDVSAAALWSLYEDVETWRSGDAQAEAASRDGPIAAGSTGTMKFRGPDALSYRLTKVEPLREFVNETAVGDIVVRVSNASSRSRPGGCGSRMPPRSMEREKRPSTSARSSRRTSRTPWRR